MLPWNHGLYISLCNSDWPKKPFVRYYLLHVMWGIKGCSFYTNLSWEMIKNLLMPYLVSYETGVMWNWMSGVTGCPETAFDSIYGIIPCAKHQCRNILHNNQVSLNWILNHPLKNNLNLKCFEFMLKKTIQSPSAKFLQQDTSELGIQDIDFDCDRVHPILTRIIETPSFMTVFPKLGCL